MVLSLIEVIGLTVKLCIELLIINLASVANARRILVPGHHVFGKHGLVEHLALWVLRLELFLSSRRSTVVELVLILAARTLKEPLGHRPVSGILHPFLARDLLKLNQERLVYVEVRLLDRRLSIGIL